MTQIDCYLHGLYPRSEALVALTRDADRGRTTMDAVEDQRRADREEFRSLQRECGISYLSSGCFTWQDAFRPFVAACPGLDAGPLTRWFDNNTFFRTPVVRGPLELDRALLDIDDGDVGLLPGPYTFARMASSSLRTDDLMDQLARQVLRPAAEEYVRRGATILHVQEPSLVVSGMPEQQWPRLADAIHALRDGLDVRIAIHTYFGDAGPWLDHLRPLPVDAVGVDLIQTDVTSLKGAWTTGLLLGCVDGRSSLLEDPGAIAAVVRRVLDIAQPPALFLSSGSDLELVPRAIADEKVRILAAVTHRVREELGC